MNKYVPQFEPFNKDSKLDVIGILLLSFMSISIIYGVTKASDDGTFFTLKPMIYIIMGILLTITYCIYNRKTLSYSSTNQFIYTKEICCVIYWIVTCQYRNYGTNVNYSIILPEL